MADTEQRKVESISKSMVAISSSFSYKITPSRCKARNPCGGFYYDPMTFDATATQDATISTDPSIPDQEMEEVDEVSRCSCFCRSLTSGHLDP